MSLSFDELLAGDVESPNTLAFPSPTHDSAPPKSSGDSPLRNPSSTHSHHSPPHPDSVVLQTQDQSPKSTSAGVVPAAESAPNLSIEIDPSLLDPSFQTPQQQPVLSKINTKLQLSSSPSDWLTSDALPFASPTQGQASTSPEESNPGFKSKSKSPKKLEPLAQRWLIDTSAPGSSGPPSAVSQSPTTPGGYSVPYSPSASSVYDVSRSNSSRDLHADGQKETSPGNGKPGVPPPKKKSHARKQPEGHIKRARNAFILFRKHVTDSGWIPASVEVKHQNISVVAAKMWREAPQEVRQKFQEQARLEKEEHQRLYPGYRYQPVFRRSDIIRRRVRKDAAEDEKVEAVAEALIKGKAGDELEKEIKEQMIERASDDTRDSEGEASASANRSTSRRRRRDQGQLSKGAIRAQRAQARAKQMRQNLLGSNLLSMSMYNAAQQQAESQRRAAMAAQAQSMPYGMEHGQGYLPVGYDIDGCPLVDPAYPVQYGGEVYGEEMYRLPPIVGYDGGGAGWDNGQVDPYYGSMEHAAGEYYPPPSHAHGIPGYSSTAMGAGSGMEYSLPPLDLGNSHGAAPGFEDDQGEDPRMRWTGEGQQTPSGHVVFNERLFDGALGSAGLSERREDDGLGSFEEAVAQADELRW